MKTQTAWAEKCSHSPMGWHCTGCNGHNASVIRNNKIEWNIDPILRKGQETGEVQIWADVPKETAAFIVRAVNCHEEVLAFLKFLEAGAEDRIPVNEMPDDTELLKRLKNIIAKAEGK